MTLFRISEILLVVSVACLALAVGLVSSFYILVAWICVVLAGQLYASALKEERGNSTAGRR